MMRNNYCRSQHFSSLYFDDETTSSTWEGYDMFRWGDMPSLLRDKSSNIFLLLDSHILVKLVLFFHFMFCLCNIPDSYDKPLFQNDLKCHLFWGVPPPWTPSLDVQSYPPPYEITLFSNLDYTEQVTCQPLHLVGSPHCHLLEDSPVDSSFSWKAEKNTCPLFAIQLLVNKRIESLLPRKAVCISVAYRCRYL